MAQFLRGLPGKVFLILIIFIMLGTIFMFFSFLPTLLPQELPFSEHIDLLPYVIIGGVFVVGGAIYFMGQTNKSSEY